jgi:hypothetical protein
VESGVEPGKIDKKLIEVNLDTADQPYPYIDLYIRTGGEQRTSGFMMWQADYAEYYWELDHFPAFSPEKLREAVVDYSRRRRRFGGDDAMEHFKFDPKVVARLDIDLRHEISQSTTVENGGKRLSDLAIEYIKNQYGVSKSLAKEAGKSLVAALVNRRRSDWVEAKKSLIELYELIKRNVGLALEPEIVASIEVGTWKGEAGEHSLRQLLAEKFRFSEFQAAKSAHLSYLANQEADKGEWEKAGKLMERYYQALKERVA